MVPVTINQVFFFSKFWGREMSRNIVTSSSVIVVSQVLGIVLLGPAYGAAGIAFAFLIAMICGLACSVLLDRYRNPASDG